MIKWSLASVIRGHFWYSEISSYVYGFINKKKFLGFFLFFFEMESIYVKFQA